MTDPDPARSHDSIGAAQHTDSLRLDGLALSLCGLALAASMAAMGWLPAWSLPLCAGPAVLATAALPLLVRWSPAPADLLKLAAFTLALSPLFAACIFSAWQLVFDARQALALCAATCAALHLASLQRRVRKPQSGRAACLITLFAVALGSGLGWLLLRGNEPRLIEPALTRASVALALDRSLPPLHPWLAGERWSKVWSADLLAAFSMRALNIAPTLAHALFSVLAGLLLPVMLFVLAASLWSDARRSVVAVALALCASLLALPGAAQASPALAPFLDAGPAALALTLSLAALACASHALRHGQRPWVGMCALFHGFALCLDFANAWPAALASVIACLAPTCDARARPRLLLALSVACLPGLAQARLLDPPAVVQGLAPAAPWITGMIAWIVLAALGSAFACRSLSAERRAVLVLCACAAAVALLSEMFSSPWTDRRGAASLGLFAMALLSAGLVPPQLSRASARTWVGSLACGALVCFGLFQLTRAALPRLDAAKRNDPLLAETACALEPASLEASAMELRAALALLRTDPRLRTDHAVLLACPVHNPYRKTRDLPQQALAACAGIALYADTRSNAVLGEAQFQPRLEELLRLYRDAADFDATLLPRIEHAGAKAVVALVRDEDRALIPALGGKLERMGFAPWRKFGGVQLYIGPRAAVPRYVGVP